MSGALTAMSKRMDPFGVYIIAFVTAVGGGPCTGYINSRTPVGWMVDQYVFMISIGFVLALLLEKRFDQ
jgi:uncharacterized membrane protein YeiH